MRDFLPAFNVASNLSMARGIVLLEDCEGAFTWQVSGTGGDDVHAFAAAAAFMGGFGLDLRTRTTSAANLDNLMVKKLMGWPESGLLVMRCRVACFDVTDVKYFDFGCEFADGVTADAAGLRFEPVTGKVYRVQVGGTYIEVAALATLVYDLQFIVIELVVDLKGRKYVSACVNGVRVDLSGIATAGGAAETGRYVYVGMELTAAATAPGEVYVDSVYVGEFLSA